MIRAILFDMDGTLIDSEGVWFETVRDAAKRHLGRDVGRKEFHDRVWFEGSVHSFMAEEAGEKAAEATDYAMMRANALKKGLRLFEGELKCLRRLKEKYVLAVTTNTLAKNTEASLTELGIYGIFDAIIARDMVKERKPNPEMLHLACRKLGVAENEAVCVGDMRRDVEAAKNAGIRAISIFNDNEGADAYAKDFKELGRIIDAWDE